MNTLWMTLTAFLLSASLTHAALPHGGQMRNGIVSVDAGNRLLLRVEHRNVGDIVREIARQARSNVRGNAADNREVSLSFDGDIRRGLERLLWPRSFWISFDSTGRLAVIGLLDISDRSPAQLRASAAIDHTVHQDRTLGIGTGPPVGYRAMPTPYTPSVDVRSYRGDTDIGSAPRWGGADGEMDQPPSPDAEEGFDSYGGIAELMAGDESGGQLASAEELSPP